MKYSAFILVDTKATSGLGHLSRCLSLAASLEKLNFEILFVINEINNITIKTLKDFPYVLLEKEFQIVEFLKSNKPSILIIDSYLIKDQTVKAINVNLSNLPVICFDDLKEKSHLNFSGVINANPTANKSWYKNAKFHALGLNFFLIRSEFLEIKVPSNLARSGILVTSGGGNLKNSLNRLLDIALKSNLEQSINLIIGPFCRNKDKEDLHDICASYSSKFKIQIFDSPDFKTLGHIYSSSKIALCAAGTTCFELAYFNTPFISTEVAKNQQNNGMAIRKFGFGLNLGPIEKVSNEQMIKALRQLLNREIKLQSKLKIDGKGSIRLANFVKNVLDESKPNSEIHFISPKNTHSKLLLEWRNDPSTIQNSISNKPVLLKDHQKWFSNILSSKPNNLILKIAKSQKGELLGVIRFNNIGNQKWELSWSVSPDHRGKGVGTQMVQKAVEYFLQTKPNHHLIARIKTSNSSSKSIAAASGFKFLEIDNTFFGNEPLEIWMLPSER